jgi:hypothetical protein
MTNLSGLQLLQLEIVSVGLNTLLASGSGATFVSSSVPTSVNIVEQIDLQLESLDQDVQDRDDLTTFMCC